MKTFKYMENSFIEHLSSATSQGASAILFGALVGGIRKVMSQGWKSWGWFLASLLVNIFFGLVAYLVAKDYGLTGLKPVILALVFGSLGEKSGDVILQWGVDFIKMKISVNNK